MKFYAIYIWFVVYPLPCGMLAILYGKVIRTFHQRKKTQGLQTSRIINQASSELTKTALTATILLILTKTYDINLYTLASFGIGNYSINSPQQRLGYLLSSINSCANPFIYALLMPVYRRQLIAMFSCRRHHSDDHVNSSSQETSSGSRVRQPATSTSITSISAAVE